MNRPLLLVLVGLVVACSPREPLLGRRLDPGHYRLGGRVDDRPQAASDMEGVEVNVTRPAINPQRLGSASHGRVALPKESIDPAVSPLTRLPEDPADVAPQERSHPRIRSSVPEIEEDSARTKWNWFAVASPVLLIAGLAVAIPLQSTELLLIGCVLALTAALIGARQCRDREQRGQGFALATMGFAAAGVLIAAIALLSRL